MFTITDRGRPRSNSSAKTISKRSMSSPPSSRRNTCDNFPSIVQEEFNSDNCFSQNTSLRSLNDLAEKHLAYRVS